MLKLSFKVHADRYCLTTLPTDVPDPDWVRGRFSSVTRTEREVSVISRQGTAPPGLKTETDFRCLEIDGAFALDSVGVVAAATAPLAEAGISLFVISVWSTDFILVADADLDRSLTALRGAGHSTY